MDTLEPTCCRASSPPARRSTCCGPSSAARIGTAVGVLPGLGPGHGGGDAAADHAEGRADRVDDLLRRHLLRRDVRRLDHLDPAEHAGRDRHHGHRARRQQDGQERPRRRGAGHRRRSARSWPAPSPPCWSRCSRRWWPKYAVQARAARVLHADGAGLHHRQRGAGQEHAARPDGAVRRPGDGAGRASTRSPARRATPAACPS